MINYAEMEPMILKKIPEIWDEYLLELGISDRSKLQVSYDEWIEALYSNPMLDPQDFNSSDEWLSAIDEIPNNVPQRLGATIVFENLIVPLLIELLKKSDTERIEELFSWFELLASDDNQMIRESLIEVTLCESLLSNNATYFGQFYPYIRAKPYLVESFKKISTRFNTSDEIKMLLSGDK